ncbi:hypothetical protein E4U54_007821 [Claviceps lovelessii]|nr:hypothetical protein E4U54_007821 [Claviceps lovelessii]
MGHSASKQPPAYDPYRVSGGLTQDLTNGLSVLGTLVAPSLPLYLQDNPMPNGLPWSQLNLTTDYYDHHPRTGVIRTYDFTVSRGTLAPDGYEREVILINGAFPGPLIEANWGDTIQVTVHNNISTTEEGLALHWHGFLHHGKPWEDGVPAVTQCPIPPGQSFTYSFEAELYGTSWYHSHYSAQYAAGLFGPMVIHGPHTAPYDIDVGPIMLSDWYHKEYFDLVEETMQPNANPVISDTNMINGKANFNCSTLPATDTTPCRSDATLASFKFQRGKTHRLRLINSGSEGLQRFSIDGHTMTVIANDFVAVEPYNTTVVTLGIGQRTDVVVMADGTLDAYWMRSNISSICSLASDPFANAVIYYDDADTTQTPQSQAWNVPDPGTCANDDLSLSKPYMQRKPITPDLTYDFDINFGKNASNVTLWSLDNVSFRGNYNSPTLLMAALGNTTFPKEANVHNTGSAQSVRVTVHNKTPVAHPIHLHGYNMYVLNEGNGTWDGTTINPENPQRRDVQMIRANGYIVIQFDAASNPGVWPFHCHIVWHASLGFLAQFLTNPTEVAKYQDKMPQVVADTCRQWGNWTNTNIPDQIDSGL